MKTKTNRREFISKGTKICAGGCLLLASSKMGMARPFFEQFDENKKPVPQELNYCGYTCPADCQFKIATIENNLEKKKEAFEAWKITERYGVEFSEDIAFCYGCKTEDKPIGAAAGNCSVRACTIEKGFECCIECKELKSCDKELWSRFPSFHEGVIEMQKVYLS